MNSKNETDKEIDLWLNEGEIILTRGMLRQFREFEEQFRTAGLDSQTIRAIFSGQERELIEWIKELENNRRKYQD